MSTLFESDLSYALLKSGIATAILLISLAIFGWLFPWIQNKVVTLSQGKIRPLKFHNFEFVSAQAVVTGICSLIGFLKIAGTFLLIYIYLSLVLGFFPETQHISENMLVYVLAPLGEVLTTFLNYIPKAIYIFVIVLVTKYVLKVVRLFFNRIENGFLKIDGFHPEWASPTYKLARLFILAFTLIIVFPHLPGSSSPAFQGVSVFLGLLISLGSSSAISNLVAGLVITYMRPFKIGDRVMIGGTVGDVVEKNLLVTRIRTIKNVDVTIPNSNVLNSHMTNYSSVADTNGLILNPRITIGYDVNWRTVHKLLLEAANRTDGLLKENKPFIFQTDLNNSYVEYELNVYTRKANNFDDIYSELRKNIQDCFNEANVEIMSPTYHSLRDGNQIHIPKEYQTSKQT